MDRPLVASVTGNSMSSDVRNEESTRYYYLSNQDRKEFLSAFMAFVVVSKAKNMYQTETSARAKPFLPPLAVVAYFA